MKERLNLTIDGALLAAMKVYASSKGISISELVESYFRAVTKPLNRKNILHLVEELDPPGISVDQAAGGKKPLAEPEAELLSPARQPEPLTKFKRGRHGM